MSQSSKLRQTQNEVLEKLSEGPVVLTQHGEATAVLVDPEQWNRRAVTGVTPGVKLFDRVSVCSYIF
ncbi:MAG: type II toxin-antitoxin system Phd/YefM family antitoxin [Candidatus Bipolaricaulia bacterium]